MRAGENKRMSPKKRASDLHVSPISRLLIRHSFITTKTLTPFSKHNGVRKNDRDYVVRFRSALIRFRGFKRIEVFDSIEYSHVATIMFDDYIEDEALDILDAFIYLIRKRERCLWIEINTPLMVDEEPIVCIAAGHFKDGIWYPATDYYADIYAYHDENGNEIPPPKNCKYFELLL